MKPDLELIYSQLDLRPSCTLEEFQRAYRKRIAELHPDRQGGAARSPETQMLLRNLIWVYATVSRFHRRYGRMPGGYPTNERHAMSSMAMPPNRPYIADEGEADAGSARRSTLTLAVLFIALLILVASWSWFESGGSQRSRSNLPTVDEPAVATPYRTVENRAVA